MEQVSKEMISQLKNIIEMNLCPTYLDDMLDNNISNLDTNAIQEWYYDSDNSATDNQLKLIKHIWLHDPQFEEEKPKKYIVRTKEPDIDGDYWYVKYDDKYGIYFISSVFNKNEAFKFDTREEAGEWTNPQMEVIELEAMMNPVFPMR